jgi:glycerophosphoryl diester phosphodiesterase
MGCTMVELDVHLSRDGAVVVHHDDRLGRCTDVKARFPARSTDFVSDYTVAELQALDAGSWYVRQLALPAAQRQGFLQTLSEAELSRWVSPEDQALYASGSVRIPTLAAALAQARELDLVVNIEIKALPRMYPGIARAVVADVAAAGMQRSVLVSSFDHEQLLEVKQLDPTLLTGVLTSDRLARPADYLQLLAADAYHPGCYDDFDSLGFNSVSARLDARGIAAVRAAGHMVFAWTCNHSGQMQALAAAGVTGVMTDYPNRFGLARA